MNPSPKPNSVADSRMPAPTQFRLTLDVTGPIPGFKNAKRFGRGRVFTRKDVKQRMHEIRLAFASQLNFAFQTTTGETSITALQRFLIALCPQDDCWKNVPELVISARLCRNDEPEGATITIERLD